MALPSSRQRRAFAPPSPTYPTNPTTLLQPHPPPQPQPHPLALSTLSTLPSRSRPAPTSAPTPLPQRIAKHALTLALLTLALFLVPTSIQHLVRALATTHEAVGRLAPTSLDETSAWSVSLGTGVLAAWHAVLIALSARAFAEGGGWRRVLGCVVVPGYLVVGFVGFGYAVATRRVADAADG
ncbi:hypothetical protein PMIN06_000064 [Paraphaeosphaeria minitans]|uniref:Uncharacterized protein n=1 Tax=Paraphaeosphaeria minitans TaxID=565426 RepID=A0A9P6KJ99_9PLEO|nr:hypothetical protein PMIN01_12848 [Paraphaeosphaeria minitans]